MTLKMRNRIVFICSCIIFVLSVSCKNSDEGFVPKPRAYFRIDLPEKKYHLCDTIFPFTFEYPVYSEIEIDSASWFNIVFPKFKGKIHFSYKKVDGHLYEYTEDAREFVYKHVPKATDIKTEIFNDFENNVYALLYHIEGQEAASPLQFYATDSTSHFLRAALYFEHIPNNDSIAPIIEFVNQDVLHFLKTIKWK